MPEEWIIGRHEGTRFIRADRVRKEGWLLAPPLGGSKEWIPKIDKRILRCRCLRGAVHPSEVRQPTHSELPRFSGSAQYRGTQPSNPMRDSVVVCQCGMSAEFM